MAGAGRQEPGAGPLLGKNVEEKTLFGGLGFLLHGHLRVGGWKASLVVRLGPEDGVEAMKEPHVREFDITGRPMQGWLLVEPNGLENDDLLDNWIQRAIQFVRTLPEKQPGAETYDHHETDHVRLC